MDGQNIGILVVEDEVDIRSLILFNLGKEGYLAWGAGTGEEGLRLFREKRPLLVILDLMLPGMDGMAVCRRIRKDPVGGGVPVLMLTAKGEEYDVVAGLEAGADDYVVKPFSPKVLLARIRTILRRGGAPAISPIGENVVERGSVVINPSRMEALVGGLRVELTATEFKLLHCLARRPGIVFGRSQLLDLVYGEKHAVTDRAVDVQIVGLRRKLGNAADMIETVRGVGYRFAD